MRVLCSVQSLGNYTSGSNVKLKGYAFAQLRLSVELSLGYKTKANEVSAAANCNNLVGTWKLTVKASPNVYTFEIDITRATITGNVKGYNEIGDPIIGYCKNGTVTVSEIGSDTGLLAFYFINGTSKFGRAILVISGYTYTFEAYAYLAAYKKLLAKSPNKQNFRSSSDELSKKSRFIDEVRQMKLNKQTKYI